MFSISAIFNHYSHAVLFEFPVDLKARNLNDMDMPCPTYRVPHNKELENDAIQQLFDKSRLEIVEELVNQGANLDVRDHSGYTPLDLAVKKNDIPMVNCLLALGADFERDYGSCGRYERETTLHLAACESNFQIVSLLLDHGADVNIQDRLWETPAMKAARAGRTDILKLLWSAGADLTIQDRHGWSPLMWAVWAGHEEVVIWLLQEAEANPDIKDCYSKTPLDIAAQRQRVEIKEILLSYGAKPSHTNHDLETLLS